MNKAEIAKFIELSKRIKNPQQGLLEPLFLAISRLVPFVACEMVIINEKKEILLTWREDKWWKGWHFPGGLMRFGETMEQRLKKTLKNELGVNLASAKFLFPLDYPVTARGHNVSLVFKCKVKGKFKDGQFFAKMPKNIIAEHKVLWCKIKLRLNNKKNGLS